MKKKSLGILGGMGPLATADLFRKIVLMTRAQCDSDHIRIYIDDNAFIPDRTAAILNGGPSPMPQMEDSLRKLERCGADVIIMPCNTAHYFLPQLQARTALPILSMLRAAAQASARNYPGKTAAILGTRGTLSTGLYNRAMEEAGVSFLIPPPEVQDLLMRVIYDGVKAGAPPAHYREDLLLAVQKMTDLGADFFVLGCTELPLAFANLELQLPLVDATTELARAAITACGYEVML